MEKIATNEDLLELGDPEKIARIVGMLNVTYDDFKQPERLSKVKDILKYLAEHPDPSFFVYKSVGSKQIDRVDFLHEYIGLNQQLTSAQQQVDSLKKQIEVYEK